MRKNRLTKNMKRAIGHLVKAAALLSESEPEGPITQPIASIGANAPVPGTSVTLETMMARVLAAATTAISDALFVNVNGGAVTAEGMGIEYTVGIEGTSIEFVPVDEDMSAERLVRCIEGKIVTDVRDAIGKVMVGTPQ